jgi:hypothetical protein
MFADIKNIRIFVRSIRHKTIKNKDYEKSK